MYARNVNEFRAANEIRSERYTAPAPATGDPGSFTQTLLGQTQRTGAGPQPDAASFKAEANLLV